MNPIKLEIFLDDKTLAGMKSVEGNMAATEAFAKQMIDHLKVQLKELEAQYKVLQKQGLAGDKEMADIQAMQGAIGGLKEQLKELQKIKQQTNETSVIGDDPAPKLNSVKMSMAQIARELPSIAMGPQMFFLAISNNIPMFTDAVGNARKEYERLTAAGQKATPVWKQLLSSLFSWQTLMATAITLTVVYGKEIGELFSQMQKGKKAALDMAEAQGKVNEALDAAELGKQIITIRSLQERWAQLGDSLSAKKKFITDNKDEFDKLGISVSNVDEAENALVTNTEAFIQAMMLRAEAAAAFKLASEEAEKALKAQVEIDKKKKEGPNFKDKAMAFLFFDSQNTPGSLSNKQGTPRAETVWNASIDKQKTIKKTAEKDAETYTKTYNEKLLESAKKLKEVGIKDKKNNNKDKTPHDYTSELADARIRAQQKIESARIAIMVEGREKRKAIAQKEYQETIAAIDKEERDTLAKLEKSKKAGKKVTPEEVQKVKSDAQTQRGLAQVQYMQASYNIEKEWRDKNQQAWIDYNKEYGNAQEKRLAIAQDYALKIGQAETEGEKASLRKKRDEDLKEYDFNESKKTLNIAEVFGNLDEQSTEALSILRDKLKEYINGAAKSLRPSDLKELQDALTQIDLKLTDRNPFRELKKSLADYKVSQEAVEKAQTDLNTVMQGGEVVVGKYEDSTGKVTTKLLTQAQAEKNLATAQSNRQTTLSNLTKAANSIGSKGMEVVNAGNEIVGMLENFGVKVPEAVGQTLDGIGQVMSGLESIDLTKPFSAVTGAISILTGVGNTIAGLFGFGGADYSGYESMVSRYEVLNSVWDELIDKKREYIDISYGAEALKSGEEALAIIEKSQDVQRNLAKARATSGASAGSHSIAYRQNKNLGNYASELYKYVAQNGNYNDITNALLGASEEQLKKVKEQMPELWAGLDGSFREHLDNIISGAEQTKEVLKQMKEAVTGISLDEFSSGYIDMLSDLDSTNEDFADNFEKYLQKAIFQSLIANKYKSDIEGLYNSWAELGKDGLTAEEAEKLKKKQQELTDSMLAEREKLMSDFGWKSSGEDTSSQSGRSGSFTTMSQEQGTKLEGLFTSLQDHASGMHKLLEDLKKGRDADHELWVQIADNTAYCKLLEDIYDLMTRQERDGYKTK